ncbi:MAG: hypothetical protein NT078_00600 [Candidatus Azambacteria bacterium]|nr:hypothetical protein [Candidatus Azambacteria bacterium]
MPRSCGVFLYFPLKIGYTLDMDDRRRLFKKIFIAVIYLAVFTGLGTGAYFLFRPTPAPTPLPTPTIYPIEVIWSQAFVAGPDLYSVAAKIRNPNTNFGASNFSYTFYLYNANGVLLTTPAGESFIWPGESKYIILGGINLTKAPVKTLFQLGESAWHEVQDFKGVDLTLGNINYGKGKAGSGMFFSVDFTASNNTPYDLDKVYVSAVVLDKDELPIAAASTLLENLKSKERRPSNIPWFSPFSGTPSRVDLSISTNLWEKPELIGQ